MINIRANTFETNSSSVHTICITDDEKYQQWVEGKLYYNVDSRWNSYPEFVTYDEAKEMDSHFPYPDQDTDDWSFQDDEEHWHEKQFLTFREFFEGNYYYEYYDKEYVTSTGEMIHAFGYYGHD